MRKYIISLLLLLAAVSVSARSVRQAWVALPDSVFPYLDKNLRLECLDLYDMKVKADVKNLLGEHTVMDSLTNDYLHVQLSPVSEFSMKAFPMGKDSVVYSILTVLGPEKESTFFPAVNTPAWDGFFIQRPDTMTEERYKELCKMIEPKMVWAEFSVSEPEVIFHVSLPLTTKADRDAISMILRPQTLRWDGKSFK
ncbi:MAG: DUF3256 family protein [Prevotellaceae bacterium]|nr:DUF3256 family protein [Prevotellaceae bacterium]